MFSSFFSTSDPTATNFHPVSSQFKPDELFGELAPKDTEWLCASGMAVETQVFYTILEDGSQLTVQVFHSSTGLWYPTIYSTLKLYNPVTKKKIWKSINMTNFVSPPPGLDKRSCKADDFSITHKSKPDSEFPETYVIKSNLATDFQVFLEIARQALVPGWKLGKGDKGGYSYLGPNLDSPEGYVIHRFWPHFKATGHLIIDGQASAVKGTGAFIHAIQGMRPNLIASRWNFAHFLAGETTAIQMEFTTTDSYGKAGAGSGGVSVNIGSLVVDGKLVALTAETKYPGEAPADASIVSKASHLKLYTDADTGYTDVPSEFSFDWTGPSLLKDQPGSFTASLQVDVGNTAEPKGLVEKVDVLGEIPKVVKAAVAFTGTKPYIYQWLNPTKLTITAPDSKTTIVDGVLYNEASYIS